MVVGAFPLAKLGTLLLRQISKPIANIVKERAKKSPLFRTYICMPPAQFYNWCEVKAKMWIMDLGKPTVVPSLNEAMAIDLGANLLGEGIIFVIASGVLYMEYVRGVRKEAAKEEARATEMDTLQYTIQELYFTTEKQDAQIRELTRMVAEMETRVVSKPWVRPKLKDDDSILSPVGEPSFERQPRTSQEPSKEPSREPSREPSQESSQPRSKNVVLQALDYIQKNILHSR